MGKQKILIIEDEIIIAINIRSILEIKGYKVCDIGISADEAINLTEKHNPGLIIMDIVLDGKGDGVKAVEEIKKKHDIPVVYLTAHSDEKTLERAKKTEPHGYIIKPISREELLTTVEVALYKHKMEKKLKLTQFSVDKTQDAIYWMEQDAKFTYVNDAACNALGYSREELLTMNVHDIDPNFPVEVWPAHWEDLRKHGSLVIEATHQAKDGRIFPVEISVNYIKQGNHEFNCAIARDITERKKAENEIIRKNEELDAANEELQATNDELDATNEELQATNEELEATNEELTQVNEEFESANEELIETHRNLAESEDRYRSLYLDTPAMLHSIDHEGKLVSVSNYWLDKMGYRVDEVIGKKSTEFLTEESHRYAIDIILPEFFKTGYCTDVPYQFVKKNGEIIDVLLSATAEKDEKGEIIRSFAVIIDITKRKEAEEQIKTSLEEKKTLLKEIHHRVKNNMQVISSLIELQASNLKGEIEQAPFNETASRIKSMALVHEKLYQSGNVAAIDFGEYIRDLSSDVLSANYQKHCKITNIINMGSITLTLDKAVPCGLIINELLSNSYKYAFPEMKKGEIKIDFKDDNKGAYCLTISDNGIGLPVDFDVENSDTLGMLLVNALTKQLNGKMKLEKGKGAKFIVTFPVE